VPKVYGTVTVAVGGTPTFNWYTTGAASSTQYLSTSSQYIWASGASNYAEVVGGLDDANAVMQMYGSYLEDRVIREQQAAMWGIANEAAQLQMQNAAYAERVQVEEVARDAAARKAETVLLAFLSEEQRATFRRDKYFDVVTAPLGRRYRLHLGWAGNIAQVDSRGREISRFCIHPRDGREFRVPDAENLLSQKLMLEFEEQEFLRTANRHAPRGIPVAA
jgi:hypothetical protein